MSDKSVLVGLSQSYIEALEEELTTAKCCYEEYKKAAQKAKGEYDQSVEWENCLRDFLNRVGITYDMVTSLDTNIANTIAHAENVCKTVGLAKDATNLLTICVRCLSDHNEELKGMIKDLLVIIECLNDSTLSPNVPLMKCLDDFKLKVEEGLLAVLDAVKELLYLMKCMFDLEYKICSSETIKLLKDGLVNDLKTIKTILDCSFLRGSAITDVSCGEVGSAYATPTLDVLNCPSCKSGCGDSITPMPLTLDCDATAFKPALCNQCGNPFLEELRNDFNRASQQTCYAKCVWDYFKELAGQAESNMNATQAALKAAQKAKDKCKK